MIEQLWQHVPGQIGVRIRNYQPGEDLTNVLVPDGFNPDSDLGWIMENRMVPIKLAYIPKEGWTENPFEGAKLLLLWVEKHLFQTTERI